MAFSYFLLFLIGNTFQSSILRFQDCTPYVFFHRPLICYFLDTSMSDGWSLHNHSLSSDTMSELPLNLTTVYSLGYVLQCLRSADQAAVFYFIRWGSIRIKGSHILTSWDSERLLSPECFPWCSGVYPCPQCYIKLNTAQLLVNLQPPIRFFSQISYWLSDHRYLKRPRIGKDDMYVKVDMKRSLTFFLT